MALQTPLPKAVRDMANDVKEIIASSQSKAQEIKKNRAQHKYILKEDISNMCQLSDFISSLDDPKTAEEILKEKHVLQTLDREIDETTKEISQLQLEVKKAENELAAAQEHLQNMSRAQPRARYAVNLFRQISKISWLTGQQPNEIKGFIRSGKSVKTFCFDEQKQSRYFITNSLWEMGEEEIW